MKYGLDVSITGAYAQLPLLAELAALAEEAGWDGFFVQDGLLPTQSEAMVDPWLALGAFALATQRLRIGALMTPLAAYRPWQIARQSVTLDHLCAGRLIFGAGLGWQAEEFLAIGEDADARVRAEKLEEGLALMRLLWKGEPFSFAGKHYQMRQVQLLPTPVQVPSIPIWCAATWPHRKPLRRAAGFDGLYIASERASGEPLTPADLQEALVYLRSQRQETSPFEVAFAGVTEPGRAVAVVEPYAKAGATWWLEGLWDERGTVHQMKERIGQGPPRVNPPLAA